MIEALIGVSIAIVLGLIIWALRARPRHADIYVEKKAEADFWRGKEAPDKGFSASQKNEIYKRDKGVCQCSNRKVWLGEPAEDEKLRDAAMRLAAGVTGVKSFERDHGEIDHIIPREFGGPSALWNGWLISRKENRGNGGKFSQWTRQAERLCIERGYKVYLTPAELKEFKQRRTK